MGRSYYVPRSAKGESRLLYIFTIKSFLTTLACGGVGAIITFSINAVYELSIFTKIFLIIPFALIGFGIGSLTIPDNPIMGPLQKAGGENVLDILLRLISFKNKKKVYLYGLNRKVDNKKTVNRDNILKSVTKNRRS